MRLPTRVAAWVSRAGAPTLAILLVTALAAALRLTSLVEVPGNPYYDAAVRSMGHSWHNFFFAAFEPSGRIGIDKPPVDLWFQVLSVKIFGYHSVPLKLPEALAGAAAVPLLYDLVRRLFGTAAGVVSALALAVLPISVLTARSDTMDSFMMALMVLAGWLVVRAAETGRARYLYGAAAVLGVDFNVKLFQALVPLPAFALLYWMASPQPLRRRAEHGLAALLVLAVVSLSWLTAVSLAPTDHRPFALGSSDGSEWNAAFVFNGVHRLKALPSNSGPAGPSTGSPSPVRLLSRTGSGLGRRIGSGLVPAFVFGALALVAGAGNGVAADKRWRTLRRGGAAAIGLWLVIGFIGFSAMSRLEVRYLEAFTPAIAAAFGAGVVALAHNLGRGRFLAFLTACAVTAVYAIYLAHGNSGLRWVILIAAVGASIAAIGEPALRRAARWRNELQGLLSVSAGCLVLVALLAVPTAESIALVHKHRYDSSTGGGFLSTHAAARLSRYLTGRQDGTRYEVAVLTPWQAASLVVLDARPVLVMANVDGASLMSIADLRDEVRRGELRYVVAGVQCMQAIAKLSRAETVTYLERRLHPRKQSPCPPAARWAQLRGTLVAGVVPRLGLYRLGPTAH